MGTFGPDPRQNSAAIPIVKRMQSKGFEPIGYTLHTYAAVQVWAKAVEQAGSLTLNRVIAELKSHDFDTVLGRISFNEKGDISAPGFVWYVWQNGDYVPIHIE